MNREIENDAGLISGPLDLQRVASRTPKVSTTNLAFYTELEYTFGRFTENGTYLQDRLEYPREGSEPGLVLIFNQETFDNGSTRRDGSFKDVDDIVTCLTRLGFNISSKYIFSDLAKEEIFSNLDKILSSDLSQVNSVLVFILTHGGICNFLSSRTEHFSADDLWIRFAQCKQLKGKPKMFVIQACKGTEDTKYLQTAEDTLLVPGTTFSRERIFPDFLVVYSTMEGKYAFRHNTSGTWLIQEICKNFTAYGRRDDVQSILARVIKCICKNYFDEKNNEVVKQIPVVVSTLSKKFYLNKNKDRHFVLTLLEKQKEIMEIVKRMSTNIDFIHKGDEDKKNGKEKLKYTVK